MTPEELNNAYWRYANQEDAKVIASLEDDVQELTSQLAEAEAEILELRAEIAKLKENPLK